MKHDINKYLNPYHKEFFQSVAREVLFYGGAGAGKSYSISDKILLQPVLQKKKLKVVVIRKTLPSLKKTCIELLQQRARLFKIPYTINKSDYMATYANGSIIWFISMDNPSDYEKIKSITDVDIIWFEEVNELTEDAYDLALLRLRGGAGDYAQVISSCNPISVVSWVYNRFILKNINNAKKFHTTVQENLWADIEYVKSLQALEFTNKNLYNVYYKGLWGRLEGAVYDKYTIVDGLPCEPDEIICGLDFGWNNQTALIVDHIVDQKHYLQEFIYEQHLTNEDLIKMMHEFEIDKSIPIYADSASPDRIEVLHRAGFNVKPSDKTTKLIKDQIDFVKSKDLYILSDSSNLLKELQSYVWKMDRDGNPCNPEVPVKFMDHLMDGMRYCIYTHCAKRIVTRVRQI